MSPERGEPKPDRVRFPFGESDEGSIEDLDLESLDPEDSLDPNLPAHELLEPSEIGPAFESSVAATPLPPRDPQHDPFASEPGVAQSPLAAADDSGVVPLEVGRRTMELPIPDLDDEEEEPKDANPFESHGPTPIVIRPEPDAAGQPPATVAPGYTTAQPHSTQAPGYAQPHAQAPGVLHPPSSHGPLGLMDSAVGIPTPPLPLPSVGQGLDLPAELLESTSPKGWTRHQSSRKGEEVSPLAAGQAPTVLEPPPGPPEEDEESAVPTGQSPAQRLAGLVRGDVLWILFSISGGLMGPILIVVGWDYYGLPLWERPGHPLHRLLGPGGGLGLVFGIIGSCLFLLNLTYVMRRRLGVLRKWISLRLWLNLHFVCGLTGGSMILIHSSLKFDNPIARLSTAAIGVAVASGLFGRYVLTHLPRRLEGEASDRAEMATLLGQLAGDLRRSLGSYPRLRALALEALTDTGVEEDERRGLSFLWSMIVEDFKAWRRTRRVARQLREVLQEEMQAELERSTDQESLQLELEPLIEDTIDLVWLHTRLNRRLSQFGAVQDLMETWRALHMILALIMVVTMILHVIIVLTYSRIAIFG